MRPFADDFVGSRIYVDRESTPICIVELTEQSSSLAVRIGKEPTSIRKSIGPVRLKQIAAIHHTSFSIQPQRIADDPWNPFWFSRPFKDPAWRTCNGIGYLCPFEFIQGESSNQTLVERII